jgi:flagellar motor switch/type III secretory pathway protein FliN
MPESAAVLKNETVKNPAHAGAIAHAAPNTEPQNQAAGWERALHLRCELTVEVPLPGFKVHDLARLAPQMVLPSQWRVGEDVPLRINGQLIAWCEFEVVRGQLAVRITELR